MWGRNWNGLLCVNTFHVDLIIYICDFVLIKKQNSVILRNIVMIIDNGGIYCCDATDQVITQTFVYVGEN